jgi:hypothetical protein
MCELPTLISRNLLTRDLHIPLASSVMSPVRRDSAHLVMSRGNIRTLGRKGTVIT